MPPLAPAVASGGCPAPVGFVFSVALATLAAACGDDEGRPRFVSGLDDDAPVDSLRTDQRDTLCDSYEAYVDTYVDLDAVAYLACAPGAVTSSDTVEECQRRVDRCMALFPEPISVRSPARPGRRCADNLARCEATVGELEQCVNVNLDFVFELLDGLSCSAIDRPGTREIARRGESLVSVCTDLGEACGGFGVLGPD